MKLRTLKSVKPLGSHRFVVTFSDGKSSELKLDEYIRFTGVFERLADPVESAKAYIDEETGVMSWSGGLDIDSEALYEYLFESKTSAAGP